MSHLPFLKALATKRIPMNRIKTNPQCILVLSPKKIKQNYAYIKTNKQKKKKKRSPSENKLLQETFFFVGKCSFLHSVQQIKMKCLLAELEVVWVRAQVAGILSFSSGFLSTAPSALHSPAPTLPYPPLKKPKRKLCEEESLHGGQKEEEETPRLSPSEGARAGCNPWLRSARQKERKKEKNRQRGE